MDIFFPEPATLPVGFAPPPSPPLALWTNVDAGPPPDAAGSSATPKKAPADCNTRERSSAASGSKAVITANIAFVDADSVSLVIHTPNSLNGTPGARMNAPSQSIQHFCLRRQGVNYLHLAKEGLRGVAKSQPDYLPNALQHQHLALSAQLLRWFGHFEVLSHDHLKTAGPSQGAWACGVADTAYFALCMPAENNFVVVQADDKIGCSCTQPSWHGKAKQQMRASRSALATVDSFHASRSSAQRIGAQRSTWCILLARYRFADARSRLRPLRPLQQ